MKKLGWPLLLVACAIVSWLATVVLACGAGVLIGAVLIQEEARGPQTGFSVGAALGVLLGVATAVLVVRRLQDFALRAARSQGEPAEPGNEGRCDK